MITTACAFSEGSWWKWIKDSSYTTEEPFQILEQGIMNVLICYKMDDPHDPRVHKVVKIKDMLAEAELVDER